jgi:hypothetical protein
MLACDILAELLDQNDAQDGDNEETFDDSVASEGDDNNDDGSDGDGEGDVDGEVCQDEGSQRVGIRMEEGVATEAAALIEQSDDKDDPEMQDALQRSFEYARQEESQDVVQAIMRSKIDASPQFVVWRLRHSSVDVQERIQEVATLAGLEWSQPSWGNGAIFLISVSAEAVPTRIKCALRKVHLVSLREHVQIINEGLSSLSKKRGGRTIKEDLAMRAGGGEQDEAMSTGATIGGDSFVADVVIVNSFFEICSEPSSHDVRSASSAPARLED